ncbi:hypothetical protein Pfo_020606 [Paulownia fortunei]|nr:hypothetical protein Pfo_020606 [Paulownia fortunei]
MQVEFFKERRYHMRYAMDTNRKTICEGVGVVKLFVVVWFLHCCANFLNASLVSVFISGQFLNVSMLSFSENIEFFFFWFFCFFNFLSPISSHITIFLPLSLVFFFLFV